LAARIFLGCVPFTFDPPRQHGSRHLHYLEAVGRAWRKTDDADGGRATLIRDMLDGQYEDPARIVAFNTARGWAAA